MGGIRATKVRELIAAVFVIALIVLLAAFAAVAANIRVPILSTITDFLGFG